MARAVLTPSWAWVLGPWNSGEERQLTAARNRSVTWRLRDNHEAGFSLDGKHADAGYLQEMVTDLRIYRDGRRLYRGRVGPTSDDGDPGQSPPHRVTVNTLDYRAVLARRRVFADDTLVYGSQDQSAIAWALISQAQARTGGNLGISRGRGQASGVNKARVFAAGDSVGEAITTLSEATDGFDWEINADLGFDLWCPQRGSDKSVVLEYGGLVQSYRRNVDPADFANAARSTGADGLVAVESEAAGLATAAEGRWDAVYADTNLLTQSALVDRSAFALDDAQTVTPSYQLLLKPGAWNGPDHIWLGDTIRVVIKSSPRLAVDTTARVYEIAVALDDNGKEAVSITTGRARPDPRKRTARVLQRITDLERR